MRLGWWAAEIQPADLRIGGVGSKKHKRGKKLALRAGLDAARVHGGCCSWHTPRIHSVDSDVAEEEIQMMHHTSTLLPCHSAAMSYAEPRYQDEGTKFDDSKSLNQPGSHWHYIDFLRIPKFRHYKIMPWEASTGNQLPPQMLTAGTIQPETT